MSSFREYQPKIVDGKYENIWTHASDGNIEAIEKELATGIDVNVGDQFGYTMVHAAASYAQIELLNLLIKKYGAEVNVCDREGDTPLHYTETVEVAKILIENGADPTIPNDKGHLAIDKADHEELGELVEYLRQFTPDHEIQPELSVGIIDPVTSEFIHVKDLEGELQEQVLDMYLESIIRSKIVEDDYDC
ncbi:ankyrin repeat-containing domain protein [Polychytrium aggregatum]|uniref:ankyrin repeat-containing domain protein n=1 Tax=Polychytrium aggregatum TaxID=110093 RepID=UPI0022FE5E02|nr:ankyrin repeat-containing domain protein [Polychytrium aggregatum]KAI9208262.1 ankyrin repeat-containing domain protein [Polychytrium aggregatum]